MNNRGWEPRTMEAQRALQELRQLAPDPGFDWGVPASVWNIANGLQYSSSVNCGKFGMRVVSARGGMFIPKMCGKCAQCVFEKNLVICADVLSVALRAMDSGEADVGRIYVQVFDLHEYADHTELEPGVKLGFRLRSRKEVDKIRETVRKRVERHKKSGRISGACILPLATVKATLAKIGDDERELSEENFGIGPFFVVFSDCGSRVYKGGLEPKLCFELYPIQFLAYLRSLLDLKRQRVSNPSGDREGRACRMSFYGDWKKPKRARNPSGGSLLVSGVRLGDWPWSQLDGKLKESGKEDTLNALVGQALAACPAQDTLIGKYRSLLRSCLKAAEAERMFLERAREGAGRSRRGCVTKKVKRCYSQAEALGKAVKECREGRLLDLKSKVEQVWPMVATWEYVLGAWV